MIQKVLSLPLSLELVVVDDGSQDETYEILQSLSRTCPTLKVLSHGRNRGKTSALKTGLTATTGDIQFALFG